MRVNVQPVSPINILLMLTVVVLVLLSPFVGAQETCWAWGGSNSASQGQFIKCPPQAPTIVTVTKTEVREVRVPVPVPGPVQRIEVPVQPAPKIRN
jgi:hypothetical protein